MQLSVDALFRLVYVSISISAMGRKQGLLHHSRPWTWGLEQKYHPRVNSPDPPIAEIARGWQGSIWQNGISGSQLKTEIHWEMVNR